MRQITSTLLAILLIFAPLSVSAKERIHHEKWYQEKYCDGLIEVRLADKSRVDCITLHYAIEYDFGSKWGECIGQAQYYAKKTGLIAGCVLINPKPRYLKRLLEGFNGAVWVANESRLKRVR